MKVLIFNKSLPPKNIGGPCGYMFNIAEYLKIYPANIDFYPNSINPSFFQKLNNKIERIIRDSFKKSNKFNCLKDLFLFYYYKKPLSREEILYINTYDFIHIHSVIHYLRYFYKSKRIHSKLIVTTHSPEPFVDEVFENYGYSEWLNKHNWVRDFFIKKELKVYKDCFRIMFPVPEAKEPYINSSVLYNDCFKELNSKFFYVPTAVNNINRCTINNHILNNHKISDTDFSICYIGRHTQVKGYDDLLRMSEHVWKQFPEARFVIGGKEGPIYNSITDDRWIELGWVNTSELLNEVDVFVLPNQETYFDLILLEVLRQGTPVVLTRTGGNKWFESKGLEGMLFYDYGNASEFLNCLERVKEIKDSGRMDDIKKSNMKFLQSEFNMPLYIERYLGELKKLS